jgi:hypothetical protein
MNLVSYILFAPFYSFLGLFSIIQPIATFFLLSSLFIMLCAIFSKKISLETKIVINDFTLYTGAALILIYILLAFSAYIDCVCGANALGGLGEFGKEQLYYAPFRSFLAINFSFIFFLISTLYYLRTTLLSHKKMELTCTK